MVAKQVERFRNAWSEQEPHQNIQGLGVVRQYNTWNGRSELDERTHMLCKQQLLQVALQIIQHLTRMGLSSRPVAGSREDQGEAQGGGA